MYFQQDNAPCHKDQIISDWFLEHDNEFTLFKWPPQSPDLNPIEHLWDVKEREIHIMDVQTTDLQQLRDAIMSIWPKSLRNVSNTLLNQCHEELRQFWRQKVVQPGTSKVYLIKWPVSVYQPIPPHLVQWFLQDSLESLSLSSGDVWEVHLSNGLIRSYKKTLIPEDGTESVKSFYVCFFSFLFFFSLVWKGKIGGNASLCSFGFFIYFRSLLSCSKSQSLELCRLDFLKPWTLFDFDGSQISVCPSTWKTTL